MTERNATTTIAFVGNEQGGMMQLARFNNVGEQACSSMPIAAETSRPGRLLLDGYLQMSWAVDGAEGYAPVKSRISRCDDEKRLSLLDASPILQPVANV